MSAATPFSLQQFFAGYTLAINKPLRWTSHDVVNKIKIAANNLKLKNEEGQPMKLKIGHAGTLDPLATGLLIICTGKHTKTIDLIQAQTKIYTGTITLGATTQSFDLEHEPDTFFPVDHITEEKILAATKKFTGTIQQIPPAHSAIKIDGKRAYKSARAGEQITMPTKEVTVHSFDIKRIAMPQIDFEVSCTKGTYIRSLANDFGVELNSGAYLSALCRTGIGQYNVTDAWALDDFIAMLNSENKM